MGNLQHVGRGTVGKGSVGGGVGGGGSDPIQSFTNTTQALAEADRDTYYTNNPSELTDGRQCWIWWGNPTPTTLDRQVYNLAGALWISESSSVTVDVERHYQVVVAFALLDPPGAPLEGDLYIVAGAGGTATGAWAGHEEELASVTGGVWGFKTPHIGEVAYDQAGNLSYIYDETLTWVRTDLGTLYLRSNKINRVRGVDPAVFADLDAVGAAYGGILSETEIVAFDSVAGLGALVRIDPGTPAVATLLINASSGMRQQIVPNTAPSYDVVWNGTKWANIVNYGVDGTRFSSGEYAEWAVATAAAPFEGGDAWIQLVEATNPIGTVTLDVTDADTRWSNIPSPISQYGMFPTDDDESSWIRFRFTGAQAGIQANIHADWWRPATAGGATIEEFDIRVGSVSGTTVDTFTYDGSTGQTTIVMDIKHIPSSADVINGYLDLFCVRTTNSTNGGSSAQMGILRYELGVETVEPAISANVVSQFDSSTRGIKLPSIIPSSTSVTHDEGALALDGLAGNRPIWYDGDDWSYVNTTRIGFRSIDSGQFFFAEGNTFASSGWTGSNHARLIKVFDYQGFPELIRLNQTGGTVTMQAPNNTQALWDVARANGFRVDYRMMFGSSHDGSMYTSIEPNNTSWGSNGRFEFSVQTPGGQLQLIMVNSGGNTTFDLEFDVMYTFSMVAGPLAQLADVLVDGVKVGEVTYGGSGTTDRGTFFYNPPGNAANEMYWQSVTMYTLSAADTNVTLDKQAISTGLRYNVPNINSAMTLRVPKGLYNFGNTFTVVNGSSVPATVTAAADDKQLFGGSTEFSVLPQQEVTFTQTSFPRGNVWAVEGGKLVINHEDNLSTGNSLHLTVDSGGAILGRHGNYIGDDVVVANPTTGNFTIQVGGLVWDTDTTIIATPWHTASQKMSCNVGIEIGLARVDVLDAAGALLNDRFCVSIYW